MEEFRMLSYCISHVYVMCYLMVFTRRRFSKGKTAAILAAGVLALIGLEAAGYANRDNFLKWLLILNLQIWTVQAAAFLAAEYRDFRALFTGLSSSNYVLAGTLASLYVYEGTGGLVLSLTVNVTVNLVFLILLFRYLRPYYLRLQQDNREDWKGLCLIPTFFYISIYLLYASLQSAATSWWMYAAVCSYLLLMFLSYLLLFRIVGRVGEEERAKKEGEILSAGIASLKREMEEVRSVEKRFALYAHDRRHFVRMLEGMLANGDNEGVIAALRQKLEYNFTSLRHFCENVPLDRVISDYADAWEKEGIPYQVQVEIPSALQVNDRELAVVLGNLLENATALYGPTGPVWQRGIRVSLDQKQGSLRIQVCGPFGGGESDAGGLKNTAYFAEKNHASFRCGREGEDFIACLILPE